MKIREAIPLNDVNWDTGVAADDGILQSTVERGVPDREG